MEQVLAGVRVLDLTRYAAGPFCCTVLGDMGAEVIRIEAPGGAEDRDQGPFAPSGDNFRFLMLGRNKKGITLDLEKPEGQDIFRRLVKKADVVAENYSPPVKEKLGLTYEALKQVNPAIILVTISAFGTTGPYKHRLGFDHIAQAESGVMSYCGWPDTPPTRGQGAWVDLSTGLHSALGVVLALMHRQKTGEGQWVEAALLDTAVSYSSMTGPAAEFAVLGQLRPRLGNSGYYSFSDTFQCKDGMVIMAATSEPLWRRLTKVIGHAELAEDPRFKSDESRYFNRDILTQFVQEWCADKTKQEVFEIMGQNRLPCGRVNDVSEMLGDPQVKARELFKGMEVPGVGEIPHPRVAVRLSKTPASIHHRAPKVGEHNRDVYSGILGLSPQDISQLQQQGII